MSRSALCSLETYIRNIVVWKHHLRLETENVYWKHTLDIGNIELHIRNIKGVWKHKMYIGNIGFILET